MELVAVCPPPPRAGADRGDAAVRRPDDGADDRHRPRELVGARPAAAPAARGGAGGRDPAADRRPRPRGRVQRAGAAPRVRASTGSCEAEGKRVRWLVSGRKGASTLRFRRSRCSRRGRASATGRPTPMPRRWRTRSPSSTSSEEVDRVVIVYNHFVSPLVQQVVEQDLLPIPEHVLEAGDEDGAARGACSATSSTSRSRRRSSSGCCRSTSRPSSTGRCSSRPRPSRARG